MGIIYGYCRASKPTQDPQRQADIILPLYPDAKIIMEKFTGTTQNRPKWNDLKSKLKKTDIVVFDEVSRMGRTGEEAFAEYEELASKGIELRFIKESYVNTSVFQERKNQRIAQIQQSTGSKATDKFIKSMIDALNEFSSDIVREQILLAFEDAKAEVDRLHRRTAEGMRTRGATNEYKTDDNGEPVLDDNGNKIVEKYGTIAKSKLGKQVETAKAKKAKAIIRKHSKSFGGSLNDIDCMKLCGCSRNSYYKYKQEISKNFVHVTVRYAEPKTQPKETVTFTLNKQEPKAEAEGKTFRIEVEASEQ